MSDSHYFVVKVSEDQVPRFRREMCYSFELVRCSECEYDHNCTHMMVRNFGRGGSQMYCPVTYCSEGKRKGDLR